MARVTSDTKIEEEVDYEFDYEEGECEWDDDPNDDVTDYDSDYDSDDNNQVKEQVEEKINILIEVDGYVLKKSNPQFYASLLVFQFYCGLLCGLESSGGSRDVGEELDQIDEFHDELAIAAIDMYNQHCKKPKLKFVQLVKANRCDGARTYNLTFTAANVEDGSTGTYEAALLEYEREYILGLFVDQDAEEVLAIVSLTGEAAIADMHRLRKVLGEGQGSKLE